MISLPKTVTKYFNVFLYTDTPSTDISKNIVVHELDLSANNSKFMLLGSVEIDIPVPQIDVTSALVEELTYQKQQLLADTEIRIRQIDEQINSLLCIEHKTN